MRQLLDHPRAQDSGPFCQSRGAAQHAEITGPPRYLERSTGFWEKWDWLMRVDYLLPSSDLKIVEGGVFWPTSQEDPAGANLAEEASDHHLVWLDLRIQN